MSKPLPKPIDPGPRKKRGGKRARKMKERYAPTKIRKHANRMYFADVTNNYAYQENLGLHAQGTGRIRFPHIDYKTKIKISQALQKDLEKGRHWGGTGEQTVQKQEVSVSCTASVAFNPLQGLVIVNPQVAEKKVNEANLEYFDNAVRSQLTPIYNKLRRLRFRWEHFKRRIDLIGYELRVMRKKLDKCDREITNAGTRRTAAIEDTKEICIKEEPLDNYPDYSNIATHLRRPVHTSPRSSLPSFKGNRGRSSKHYRHRASPDCNTVASFDGSSSESRGGLNRNYRQAWENLHETTGHKTGHPPLRRKETLDELRYRENIRGNNTERDGSELVVSGTVGGTAPLQRSSETTGEEGA